MIQKYEPYKGGLTTRLEREFARLELSNVELVSVTRKMQNIAPLKKEKYLFPMDENTNPDVLLSEVRRQRKQRKAYVDFGFDDMSCSECEVSREEDIVLDEKSIQESEHLLHDNESEATVDLKKQNTIHLLSEAFEFDESKLFRFDRKKLLRTLKDAFLEFYRGLYLIKQYARLNIEAIERLLMKYDKYIITGSKSKNLRSALSKYPFFKRRMLKVLMKETEHVYALAFTKGHRTEAMEKLKIPKANKQVEMTTFKFGFMLGVSFIWVLIMLYLLIISSSRTLDNLIPGFIAFRIPIAITVFIWLWGFNIWIWSMYRVNYPFLFEFSARRSLRHQILFTFASVSTLVTTTLLLIYTIAGVQYYDTIIISGLNGMKKIPLPVFPIVILCAILLLFLFSQYQADFWILKSLRRIFIVPFVTVHFQDFFVAEQNLSLVLVFHDIAYTLCHLAVDAFPEHRKCDSSPMWIYPVITSLIVVQRSLQCLRRWWDLRDLVQILNIFRYALLLLVVWFSYLGSLYPNATPSYHQTLWPLALFLCAAFHFYWDVVVEWNLGHRKEQYLRAQLLFPAWWYYCIMVLSLFLRFLWPLSLSPEIIRSTINPFTFGIIVMFLELVRKSLWNGIMLEKEQLNNGSKFRSIKLITQPLSLRYN